MDTNTCRKTYRDSKRCDFPCVSRRTWAGWRDCVMDKSQLQAYAQHANKAAVSQWGSAARKQVLQREAVQEHQKQRRAAATIQRVARMQFPFDKKIAAAQTIQAAMHRHRRQKSEREALKSKGRPQTDRFSQLPDDLQNKIFLTNVQRAYAKAKAKRLHKNSCGVQVMEGEKRLIILNYTSNLPRYTPLKLTKIWHPETNQFEDVSNVWFRLSLCYADTQVTGKHTKHYDNIPAIWKETRLNDRHLYLE